MLILCIILGIFAFILLLIILISVLPFTVCIDTLNSRYEFYLSFLFRIKYVQDERKSLRMHILFFPVTLSLSSARKFSLRSSTAKKPKKKSGGFSYGMISPLMHALFRILRSFRIKQFDIGFDTGDFPLNAQLVPVLFHFSGEKMHFAVNFENENYACIELKNNLFSFIRYGLPLYFKLRKIRKRKE